MNLDEAFEFISSFQETPSSPPKQNTEEPITHQEEIQNVVPYIWRESEAAKKVTPKQMTEEDVIALAQVAKEAEVKGILTRELAQSLLPMAMVESHPKNFGINKDLAIWPKPSNKTIFQAMLVDPEEGRAARYVDIPNKKTGKPEKFIGRGGFETSNEAARMMASILAVKSYRNGDRRPMDEAIELYNGEGKAIERYDGKAIPADSKEHLRRVQEAKRMLSHPINKKLVELFNKHYNPEE